MKKIMRVGVLSLLLIASLLLLHHQANAIWYIGHLSLQINGGTNSCSYGTSLNFGAIQGSNSLSLLTGDFFPNVFYCSDNAGTSNAWNMTLQATTDLTGTYGQTIPRTGLFLKTYPTTMTGLCVASVWTTSFTQIATVAQTIIGKTSATWNACTLTVTGIQLYIIIPASQAIGVYTWALNLDLPF